MLSHFLFRPILSALIRMFLGDLNESSTPFPQPNSTPFINFPVLITINKIQIDYDKFCDQVESTTPKPYPIDPISPFKRVSRPYLRPYRRLNPVQRSGSINDYYYDDHYLNRSYYNGPYNTNRSPRNNWPRNRNYSESNCHYDPLPGPSSFQNRSPISRKRAFSPPSLSPGAFKQPKRMPYSSPTSIQRFEPYYPRQRFIKRQLFNRTF